jgi:hypothetical protein
MSRLSVRGAAFLGFGAVVGAGIFALLGEAATVAGSAVWLSFLLSGTVAALLGYTVAKLGVRYLSSGVVSNTVDLAAIALVGSACSLMLVGIAGYRLRETGSQVATIVTAIAATAIALVFFVADTARNAPETFTAMVAITALCVVLDLGWKRVRGPARSTTAQAS